MIELIKDILRSWKNGLTYKSGAETWYYEHCRKERINEIVKELKR